MTKTDRKRTRKKTHKWRRKKKNGSSGEEVFAELTTSKTIPTYQYKFRYSTQYTRFQSHATNYSKSLYYSLMKSIETLMPFALHPSFLI